MTPYTSRLSRRTRRFWCVLMIGVLGVAPVLSAVAHAHEAAHSGFQDAHFHAVEPHAEDGHHEHGSRGGLGDVLHGLAHAAHACGHVTAIIPASPLVLPVRTSAEQLPDCSAGPGDFLVQHPFRPPIHC
jgi:hypothetical protein